LICAVRIVGQTVPGVCRRPWHIILDLCPHIHRLQFTTLCCSLLLLLPLLPLLPPSLLIPDADS
jgi:hypothetical protein